jgi:AcrR family transcriptional regulator
VVELASGGRLDDVSVSELSRAAGVTRDTFYRHASSVTELLAVALHERLEADFQAYISTFPPRSELVHVLARSETDLLRHVKSLAVVYSTALSSQNSAPVRRALVSFLQGNLELALREYPELAPLPPAELDERAVSMIASYAASGTVGAIEQWLASGDLEDVDQAARIIASGAPYWWAKATGRQA